jgi:hypothetical protein
VTGPPLGVRPDYCRAGRQGACPARDVPAMMMKHGKMRKVAARNSLRGWRRIKQYAPATLAKYVLRKHLFCFTRRELLTAAVECVNCIF